MISHHENTAADQGPLDVCEAEDGPRVLVVEDSRAIRELVVWLLRASGYRVLAAENGVDAKALLATARPTLIVSDLNMPRCDGWELLAFCHAHYPEIPVLIISGEGLGRRPEIERWAVAFVAKPFDLLEFRTAVENVLFRAA